MLTVRLLLCVTLLLVTAAACSSDGDDLPEGFVRFEGDGYSFAHPAAWEAAEETDQGVEVAPPGGDEDALRARVDLAGDVSLDLAGFVPLYLASGAERFDDWHVEREETDVGGTDEAELVTVTYTDGGQPFRGLVALGKDGERVVALHVGGAEDRFDRELAETIVGTLDIG